MKIILSGGILLKKAIALLLSALLLSGCTAEETFETIADEIVLPVMAQPREITVTLPDNALAPVLAEDSAQVYLSDDYEIILETRSAGDLNATIQALSGYEKDQLTVLNTRQEGLTRYDFVWSCAGEAGDRLGRAVVLDDGQYHYCMSVLRNADSMEKSQIVWEEVFQSFTLA